jgi:hypothetical protein
MNTQTHTASDGYPKRTVRNTLKKSSAVMVDGKLYGPTNYQISVWEYEGGCYLDFADDPLRNQKSFLKKTYSYFTKNLLSIF